MTNLPGFVGKIKKALQLPLRKARAPSLTIVQATETSLFRLTG